MASDSDAVRGDVDLNRNLSQGRDSDEQEDSTYADATLSAVLSLFPRSPISRASIHALPELIAAWVHVFVLLPLSLCLAVTSHVFLNRSMWARGGGPPRLSFPIRRARNWSLRDTASVAVVSHLLPAFTRLSRTQLCPSAEKLIPYFSQNLFGVKHQGWSIGGVSITLDPLPAEVAVTIPSRATQATVKPPQTDSISAGSAVFIWKSHASNVHHHAVQSFKPAVSCGGIGAGAAREDERVILLLSGASYADRDPVAGLLACNLVNLSGLRTLCVNWRKPVPSSSAGDGAFPAGLNDALQAYIHLVRTLGFKPENVCLTAEGSGAGVAMGLMIWLSALANDGRGANLGRPGKVILWTPWCDLTMRSPTWQTNAAFDIISPRLSREARDFYVSSVLPVNSSAVSSSAARPSFRLSKLSRAPSQQDSDSGIELDASSSMSPSLDEDHGLAGPDDQQKSFAKRLSTQPREMTKLLLSSIPTLGVEHPLLSPGLPLDDSRPFNTAVLSLLGRQPAFRESDAALPVTSYLIFCGKDSVFCGEAASLSRNLDSIAKSQRTQDRKRDASRYRSLEISLLEAIDTPTHFNVLPSTFMPRAQEKVDQVVRGWLVGDVA